MVRVLTWLTLATLLAFTVPAVAQEKRHDTMLGVDVAYVNASGYDSWTGGAVGKLRYSDSGLKLARAFLDYEGRITDTVQGTVVLEAYDDGLGTAVDLTESYVEWRPVPRSRNRYRLKIGAFYPRMSLENVERGWSNPYLQSSSAINTWIAEEVRAVGAELSWSRKPASLGGSHEFSVNGAVFWGNDPAGTLVSWKGWSIHDRQTRLSDELPLPALPQIGPGGVFRRQDPHTEPIREIDGAAGYYVNVEWRYANRILVRAMGYNNEADPTSISNGQYGWYTEFSHIALQATLPGEIGLLTQWLDGTTAMGPNLGGGIHALDVGFDSYFLLLTRAWDRHRVAVRFDDFATTDNDFMPGDNNNESGYGWTAGYQVQLSNYATLGLEYLRINTTRPAFEYFQLDRDVTEEQVQLTMQLRF
jgi:hypothetical protein